MVYVDWMLFSDNKMLICRKKEEATYQKNKFLVYQTEKEYNKIDLVNNKFIRKTDELFMEIDFKEKTCKFDFGTEGTCKFDVECSLSVKSNSIVLVYSIDESTKKVKVILK